MQDAVRHFGKTVGRQLFCEKGMPGIRFPQSGAQIVEPERQQNEERPFYPQITQIYADYAGEDCRIEERGLCCSERERSNVLVQNDSNDQKDSSFRFL